MRRSPWALVAVIAMLFLAAGGGLWWYMAVPHTPEAQFAYAQKLEKALRGDAATKSAKELQPEIDETIEQYRRVGTRFGANPKAADGLKRIAKIHEEVMKDADKAIATLDDLIKAYPDEANAGYALLEQARLMRAQADLLKPDNPTAGNAKYKQSLAKLEAYRTQFEKGKDAASALMEIGRIWQDGLEDPLIKTIETFEKVLRDYPGSEHEPEALFRLAKAYEKAKEFKRSLELYARLLELYPKCKWAAEATYARGKILADEMDEHEKAAKEFEKMSQDFPDDPRAGSASSEAKTERTKAASEEGEKYGKSRYGGTIPFDTSADKALPPAEMLKQFTAQKLDAQSYDLNVEFKPSEHRITVDGTLKLVNRGEDKNDLLLMLGSGLNISKLAVDGTPAESKHSAETLKVILPAVLKKDAPATLTFSYTGQYADAKLMATLKPGPGGGTRGAKPETQPATATAPATETASATEPGGAGAGETKYAMDPQMALGDYGYALSGASWYPITIIGDVFDAHVTIKTPANMEAVCNGAVVRREKSTVAGTEGVFEFQTKNPVFGLYFAYGPYVVQESQVGPIHFYTYFRPQNASKHQDYVDVTNKILSFYGSKFDGFPYEKMAIVETPLPPFLGGVGPASLMFLQGSMVDHKEVPETLLAHELAHQWFGNLIPINITDPHYNQWLSEGFATYCDAMYTEFKDGPKPFQLHIVRYNQLFFQFAMMASKGTGAIKDTFSPMSPLYRPVVYEKGALVLHMLRHVMGDDKFFQLMRDYVETYKNKQTTVDDFRHLASQVFGEDLSWFFSEWYDQSVFAHWKVTADVTPDGSGGGAKTHILITQPDDLVRMPADVTLIGPKDEHQLVPMVMLDKKENTLDVTTPFKPVKVIVDEENWVLKRPGSDNIWSAEKEAAAH
jgi:TolA-binding protein